MEFLAAAAASVLVVSVFLISSADRFVLRSDQYAAVIASVLVDLANTDRTSQDLPALTIDAQLTKAAQLKANDMAQYSYFAHVSPTGVDPWHWFSQAGYKFDYAGENLAVDFSDSDAVNTAWMNSPTHRENILDPHYTEIGIATAEGVYEGHPTTFVVQEFGTPAGATAEAQQVAQQSIPQNPTVIATASATGTNVLGETSTPKPKPKPIAVQPAPKNTDVLGSSVVAQPAAPQAPTAAAAPAPMYASWWQHLYASPLEMLRDVYYFLAFLVLFALALTTGLELKWHHRGKAVAAGFVLALICALFIFGNDFVFGQPTITANASMTAAAGLTF